MFLVLLCTVGPVFEVMNLHFAHLIECDLLRDPGVIDSMQMAGNEVILHFVEAWVCEMYRSPLS